ncbi:MAG TPA: hypothetical protein VGM41_15620, partial [Chitinophagaceae bacterium]
GRLESYKFFGDSLAYSYNNEYDKNGQLIKHEGGALVTHFIREINPDSIIIKALFFSLNKSFQSVKVIINDTSKLELQAKDDHVFSNMKSFAFGLNIRNKTHAKFLYLIRYNDNCTGKDTLVNDTANFVRPQ